MIPPDSWVPPICEFGESASDVTRVASTSVFHGFPSPSSLGSGPHYYSDTRASVNFDLGQDCSSVFLPSNLLLDSITSDAAFTHPDLSQGGIPQVSPGLEYDLGPMPDGDPVMNNVPQTIDEVLWYSVSSSFDPRNPNPQPSSFGQDIEDSFQITVSPYGSPLVGIPPPGWGIGQPEARFSYEISPTFNFEGPTVGIDGSSYPLGNIQTVDPEAVQSPPYTASLPFEQQSILSGEPGRPCKWKDGEGPVCEEPITSASLSSHLAKHGIKNMTRGLSKTCHWVGCNKSMNRENMVRHIREVHLRVRRPSKR